MRSIAAALPANDPARAVLVEVDVSGERGKRRWIGGFQVHLVFEDRSFMRLCILVIDLLQRSEGGRGERRGVGAAT